MQYQNICNLVLLRTLFPWDMPPTLTSPLETTFECDVLLKMLRPTSYGISNYELLPIYDISHFFLVEILDFQSLSTALNSHSYDSYEPLPERFFFYFGKLEVVTGPKGSGQGRSHFGFWIIVCWKYDLSIITTQDVECV